MYHANCYMVGEGGLKVPREGDTLLTLRTGSDLQAQTLAEVLRQHEQEYGPIGLVHRGVVQLAPPSPQQVSRIYKDYRSGVLPHILQIEECCNRSVTLDRG